MVELEIKVDSSTKYTFNDDSIFDMTVNEEISVIGTELPIGTLEASVYYNDTKNTFQDVPYGTPVYVWQEVDEIILVRIKMYVVDIQRTGKKNFTIKCEDIVGILDHKKYYGAVFGIGQFANTKYSFQTLIESIFLTDGLTTQANSIEYKNYQKHIVYENNVQDEDIYGMIPVCTKREALQQALFVANAYMVQNDDTLYFRKLNEGSYDTIDDTRIYNEGSVEKKDKINTITMQEYEYYPDFSERDIIIDHNSNTEDIIVFDNFIVADQLTVMGGGSIVSNNGVAAVVKGIVRATKTYDNSIFIFGKSEISKVIASAEDGKDLSVGDVTLVTVKNSGPMMDKLVNYYSNAHKENNAFLDDYYKWPGKLMRYTNIFGSTSRAWMYSKTTRMSKVWKATCKYIAGYTGVALTRGYIGYTILTGSGTWKLPTLSDATIKRIKVILIGGGQGGSSGYAGEDGQGGSAMSYGGAYRNSGGAGGDAGHSGESGRIFIIEIENPKSSYAYNCGVGGSGGLVCSSHETANEGSYGSATRFGDYTSASGNPIDPVNGFFDPFTRQAYGRASTDENLINIYGGKGGDAYCTGIGSTGAQLKYETPGKSGGNPKESGGSAGSDQTYVSGPFSQGGNGGGGTYGVPSALLNGTNASYTVSGSGGLISVNESAYLQYLYQPVQISSLGRQYYGSGGLPGAGGGGGGAGGSIYPTNGVSPVAGVGGKGLKGSKGGQGGDGCILIYY